MTQQVLSDIFGDYGWEAVGGFFPQNGNFLEDFLPFEEFEGDEGVDPQFFENAEVSGGGFFPQVA